MNKKKKAKININYIFYGFLFLFVFITSVINISSIHHGVLDYTVFFLVNSFGQALLEALGLVIITYLSFKYFPHYVSYFILGFIFIFSLTHLIDFILIKVMDLSFWEALGIALDETWDNFIETILLTNIPGIIWIIMGLSLFIMPFIGIALYKLTEKICRKKPLKMYRDHLFQSFVYIGFAIFFWDVYSSPILKADIHSAYKKALPWKTTFLFEKNKTFHLNNFLPAPNLKKEKNEIINFSGSLEKKPNIYIFVIESLRNDYITKKISPNLFAFQNENISFDLSLASSNTTHNSWFSIFYGKHPFYWAHYKNKKHKMGSYPLNILKNAGYKINVFTSSGLQYHKMDDILFGKKASLVNSIYTNKNNKLPPHLSDKTMVEKVITNSEKENNVFIVFLESTHFNYSWPEEKEIKFFPITESMNSFMTYTTQNEITLIKNRYKNAINYIDDLFYQFIKDLKEKDHFDDSIIVVCSDHGEEFFEKGRLFHASHLSNVQTHIPIMYKIGKTSPDRKSFLSTHIDIFPTILSYLFGDKYPQNLFDGSSILSKHRSNTKKQFAITTRFNASRPPNEFSLHNGKQKITLKFNKRNIFDTKTVQILSIKDKNDHAINLNLKDENNYIEKVKKFLDSAFSKTN